MHSWWLYEEEYLKKHSSYCWQEYCDSFLRFFLRIKEACNAFAFWVYAVEKACDEDKWPEGTYRNVMRGYHTVVIDAGVGQSR